MGRNRDHRQESAAGCERAGTTGDDDRLLRVGELAKAVGKSVRAIHLYEELGLLRPVARSIGGFRLFRPEAIARIGWIGKLQAIGFSLPDIQEFVKEFERAGSGRSATDQVRRVFSDKLEEIRRSIAKLRALERDLESAIDYMESCRSCEPGYSSCECRGCEHQGHDHTVAPELFAELSQAAVEELEASGVDVTLAKLLRAQEESH